VITFIAPKWPMTCGRCGGVMGYWVPGLPMADHRCDDCQAAVFAESIRKILEDAFKELPRRV